MKKTRLIWQIYSYFLLAALTVLALVTINAIYTLRHFQEETVTDNLKVLCHNSAGNITHAFPNLQKTRVDQYCKSVGTITGARMTVILADGEVIGDSVKDPSAMDNHADRSEIKTALRGTPGESVRYSDTLRKKMKYYAMPLHRGTNIIAVVRLSLPLSDILWMQRIVSRQLIISGFLAVIIFAVMALFLSQRITKPLEDMRGIAIKLANGELSARAPVLKNNEIGSLAATLNGMAEQLEGKMEMIVRQQVELQAVLSCMVEGVIAIAPDERILYLNNAARRLLHIAPGDVKGRFVQEIVRQHNIQAFIIATLTGKTSSETDIILREERECYLQLHGTPLMDPAGQRLGGLIIMADITGIKRLEQVRSDFVANVSHELKTPITALKGSVETMLDNAALNPDETRKFVMIMSRHVSRMEAIVNDLLCLSRMESEEESGNIEWETIPLSDILEDVAQSFSKVAHDRNILLNVESPDNITARVNRALLEQAVGNLVDNAVKYSYEGTSVSITAKQSGDQVSITVSDEGPGIEKKHLSRIFERFYRGDKARSRALGGTGLGLSIVRHIVRAHHGSVSVESSIGKGTIFSINLPGQDA